MFIGLCMVSDMVDSMGGFVEQLVEQTRLTQRQAQVYTLRKCGHPREEIVDALDISEGAVDSHYSSARDVISTQVATQQLHFYRSEAGRVPLEWRSWFTADQASYVLSKPRVDLIAGNVRTLEDDVLFLTVYQAGPIDDERVIRDGPAQYIPIEDGSVEEVGRALRMVFDEELGEHEAMVFDRAYETFVDDAPRTALYNEVFGGGEFTLSSDFLAELSGSSRFVVFSESDSLSDYRDSLLVGQSFETSRPVCLSDFDFDGWLSIIGMVGSGKTFTLDLLVGQISRDDVSIIEFNPFVQEERDVQGDYELHPLGDNVPQEEYDVDEWFDSVSESVEETDDVVCAVADEAHYLLRQRPERFAELVSLAEEEDDFRLLTTMQSVEEVVSESGNDELYNSGTWLFHRMGSVPDGISLTVPERVTRLSVAGNRSDIGSSAFVIESGSTQGFEFSVSLDGFEA